MKSCPICNEIFDPFKNSRESKTCSVRCSNILFPKRIKIDRIKKGREKLKTFDCIVCQLKFEAMTKRKIVKTCSAGCRKKLLATSMNSKVQDGDHKGWVSRNNISYPERFFMEVLNNLSIPYKFNFTVTQKELGSNKGSYYALDFFIIKGNARIDLEIDGKQHEEIERKQSDIARDKMLRMAGYEVYRIKWKNLRNEKSKEYIKNEIKQFKDWYNNLLEE